MRAPPAATQLTAVRVPSPITRVWRAALTETIQKNVFSPEIRICRPAMPAVQTVPAPVTVLEPAVTVTVPVE